MRRYGPDAVYAAGLAALGFPATWIDRIAELEKVQTYLENLERTHVSTA